MKKLFTLIAALAMTMTALAQPLLVGHRGSYWGVANTSEAFINGAKKGYQYLECDVKVTSDKVHIISHDDNTATYGDVNLTIASSTLAQLKEVNLTQTRGGVTYTGKLCTLSEYLDICAEYNVLPVIELKWATGINSNDTSGIPALIKEIEGKGFRTKCIILTSMKPCLEYIRTNYPDIELQFLTGQYWESHFDWCVQWKIDVDIEAGNFTKSTVTRYHEAGLKVNMWTANTDAAYKTYGNYGCDFITTDYLDPAALPDLDASITFPPNLVDYPENAGTIQGTYEPEQVVNISTPTHLDGLTVRRAIIKDSKWYILALDASNAPVLSVVDPETGTEIKRMSTTGIAGGTVALNDIAMSADGVLLGCNLATVPFTADGTSKWVIYKWTSDDAAPEVYAEVSSATRLGNFTSAVAGRTFAVSGKLSDLYVYAPVVSATATTYRVAGIKFADGVEQAFCYAMENASYTEALWGKDVVFHSSPFSRTNILIDSPILNPVEYTFDWAGTRIPMVEYASFASGALNAKATGVDFFRYGSKIYAYAANCDDTPANATAKMYDVTAGIGSAAAVSGNAPESMGAGAIAYMTADTEYANGDVNLYLYAAGEGMSKYVIKGEAENDGNTGEVDFALELLWQNSMTTNNAPEHIDGTNAQQGAAANGLFYVNDCVDKKIYIFDHTGCLGSIDGGAGWGCTVDDAGNIIVRNDKGTSTAHSIIIYPAGATVDNPGTPISLDITVPLAGQTNFISASGDVLGKGGNLYMYPNGQSAINIVSIANGAVTGTKSYTGLTIAGSTAGYVIPINNNTENWIYQVRANGYYSYNGGTNEALLAGRASTTAPARNSTVGGEYFTLSGHNIFVHNSGANYLGGFTMRDLTADAVITSVAPIGTLGYVAGGNYSVANWMYAEKIDAGSYYLYQYCPANGMAVYKFYDKNYKTSEVEDVMAEATEAVAKVYPNPAVSTVEVVAPADIKNITVYSLSGAQSAVEILSVDSNKAMVDVSVLPAGMYIMKIDSEESLTVKFVKK